RAERHPSSSPICDGQPRGLVELLRSKDEPGATSHHRRRLRPQPPSVWCTTSGCSAPSAFSRMASGAPFAIAALVQLRIASQVRTKRSLSATSKVTEIERADLNYLSKMVFFQSTAFVLGRTLAAVVFFCGVVAVDGSTTAGSGGAGMTAGVGLSD